MTHSPELISYVNVNVSPWAVGRTSGRRYHRNRELAARSRSCQSGPSTFNTTNAKPLHTCSLPCAVLMWRRTSKRRLKRRALLIIEGFHWGRCCNQFNTVFFFLLKMITAEYLFAHRLRANKYLLVYCSTNGPHFILSELDLVTFHGI